MTVNQLAQTHNISERAIRAKAKKALQAGTALKIGDSSYKVELSSSASSRGKVYKFSKQNDTIIVDMALNDADKKWLKAPKDKQHTAILKAKLVAQWERRDKSLSFDKFIKTLSSEFNDLTIAQASFFRWVKAVRKAKELNIPPSYLLLDNRGGMRGSGSLTKPMQNFLENEILRNPTIKYKRLWQYLKNNFDNVPSYSTIERFAKRFMANNTFVMEFASNPTKAVGKLRPAFGRMDANITYANQLWELDATPADIITADGKRLTISAGIDVYSRRVVAVIEETASFTTLSKLFRKAIKILGIPDAVKTDNGKDYTSNNFSYMCQRLQTEQILTPPYSGYYKPHIERFFRTMSHELFEELPGYIGHNVAQREAIQNRQTFQKKLEAQAKWREEQKNGNEFAKKFALKKENLGLSITLPITRAELEEWLDKWIKMYENRLHRGINAKPIEKFNNSVVPIKRVSDQRVLDILVGLSELKKITKKGITWNKIVYTAPELWEFVGEKVYVLMDDDLGKVYVYDTSYNYITTATEPEFSGKSRAEFIKATKKFDKKVRKVVKMLEELRAEPNEYMKQHIDLALEQIEPNQTKEQIGYEFKTDLTKSVIEALEDNNQEVHEELKDDSIVPTVDTKPVFNSPYDRFIYELKNNCVSEKTMKLAKKYPQSWEAANKAAS